MYPKRKRSRLSKDLEKLSKFIQTSVKTKVDYDKAYGPQCTDIFRQCCSDVWNIPHTGSVEGAKDLYLKYNSLPLEQKYFSLERNPQVGDAAVWDATVKNPYGHVAIVISVYGDDLIVLEQDGFRQDGAKVNHRDCSNLLGCLRYRGWA